MKIPAVLTGLMLCFSLFLNAQNFDFGIQAGLNLTNIITPETRDFVGNTIQVNPQSGININAYLAYNNDKLFGYSIEPGYVKKGAFFQNSPATDLDDYNVNLHYIQVPALVNINLKNKIFCSIGPEISFLLNANFDPDSPIADQIYDEKLELSGILGIGYHINSHLSVGGRYNRGLSPISKITYTDENGAPDKEANEYNKYGQVFIRYTL